MLRPRDAEQPAQFSVAAPDPPSPPVLLQIFGQETKHLGFIAQGSPFRRGKFISTEQNQPCFHMGSQYGEELKRDKFKVDSIPKETMKKVFGRETMKIGYAPQDSTFKDHKSRSDDQRQPCFHMGSQYGEALTRDKYKVDSIPKETMKKIFGMETAHIGYKAPDSTFRRGKIVSTELNQPCFHMGSQYGEALMRDKYKVDSIPKETMKMIFGRETGHIGYIEPQTCLSKVAYSFGTSNRPGAETAEQKAAKIAGSATKVRLS